MDSKDVCIFAIKKKKQNEKKKMINSIGFMFSYKEWVLLLLFFADLKKNLTNVSHLLRLTLIF